MTTHLPRVAAATVRWLAEGTATDDHYDDDHQDGGHGDFGGESTSLSVCLF